MQDNDVAAKLARERNRLRIAIKDIDRSIRNKISQDARYLKGLADGYSVAADIITTILRSVENN